MLLAYLEYFKSIFLLILTEDCYETFFTKLNFFDVPCLKAALSKILGYGIIAGSVLVKVPQIFKILSSQSAEGISILGQILELYSGTVYVAYNYVKHFPFSSWGDGVFMIAQTSTIAGLSLHYIKGDIACFLFLGIYTAILYFLFFGYVAVDVLWNLQGSSIPVMFIGKMIQAFQNYQNKFMGQQSVITVLLLFLGSLARVFTSVQETGDPIIVTTYSLATFANGILLMQFGFYPACAKVKRPARTKKQQRPQPPPKKKKQR